MAKLNLSVIDTSPGNDNPLSPPSDWIGSAKDYWQLICERYRRDLGIRQSLELIARNYDNPQGIPIVITGQFGETAIHIIRKINDA